MRYLPRVICAAILVSALCLQSITHAADIPGLYYQFVLTLEASKLDNLSLGDDPEVDTNGRDRELGQEIDLVVAIEAYDGFELVLVAAEFDAG